MLSRYLEVCFIVTLSSLFQLLPLLGSEALSVLVTAITWL